MLAMTTRRFAVDRPLATTRISCYTVPVANLTITVDDEVLKRARIRALEQGTSVNAVLARYLKDYSGAISAQQGAVRALDALADQNSSAGGRNRAQRRGQRHWSREDLHER